ncbi:MAG TPA: cytochrome c family protein [Alphaproteobacteria bacterium]|nr:cytochrome c family protein [Alphaproteobacteria bacterium]
MMARVGQALWHRRGLGITAITAVWVVVALGALQKTDTDVGTKAAAAGSTPSFQCGRLTVPFNSTVPGDALPFNQLDANCFGWWEFITLNWPTEQGAGFGDPGDLNPVQWETYMVRELLFQPGAATPPSWGTQPTIPPNCQSQAQLTAKSPGSLRFLRATSKFTSSFANTFDFPSSIDEAAPTDAPNWLGAQNGTNVWYEVRINQDEYNYVVSNQFYNADNQAAWVNNGNGRPMVLPKGSSGGQTGAIELKAAWMEVPDPTNSKWNRYKLSPAVVIDPASNTCRSTTVALVGLHIIHKTQSQPTWFWATFEHVDNVPGPSSTSGSYNFYNANCQAQTVEVSNSSCLPQGVTSPVTVSCTPNTPPPYYLGPGCPGPVPIQVSRVVPIDSDAQKANAKVQAAIKSAFPNSVWQNYQLVNVMWSTSPTQDPAKPVQVPLQLSSMLPSAKVANTTLETYAQTLSCTDCHRYATIAPTAANPNPPWGSDFSFAIGSAAMPAQSQVKP